jgi:NAD(P)-dependent dehydrogenase (short-subunit alcohol dehydrogenase family)
MTGGAMHERFAGKVAVVAGCARPPGMGFATALRLARAGASVACVEAVGAVPQEWGADAYDSGFVTPEMLDAVRAEVDAAGPADAVAFPADPFDQGSWEVAASEALARFGRIDICCALMGTTGTRAGNGSLLDVSPGSWQRCIDVNVTAPLLLSRACARAMIGRGEGGAIVLLSSYAAVMAPVRSGAVAAARAATNTLTTVLAAELAPHNIRVNAVMPLGVQSSDPRFPNPGLTGAAGAPTGWAPTDIPMGRPQSPDETAAAIEFLCSDEASYISGVCLPVAGGSHTHW